jgi:hypothetical protein
MLLQVASGALILSALLGSGWLFIASLVLGSVSLLL